MDELNIMNEAGFGIEWIRFNEAVFDDARIEQLVREVYAEMGVKESAEAVLAMIYVIIAIVDDVGNNITRTSIREMQQMNMDFCCHSVVNAFIRKVQKEKCHIDYPFNLSQEAKKEVKRIAENIIAVNKTPQYLTIEDGDRTIFMEYNGHVDYCIDFEEVLHPRTFTLDEIVDYAIENLTLDSSVVIQTMLYTLMVVDGTKKERAKVTSIPNAIKARESRPNIVGQMVGQQNFNGDLSGLEALIKAFPEEKLTQLLGKL